MFEPTLNLFSRNTCPQLDPNDGITARGCAWMSPEETAVVFVQCFHVLMYRRPQLAIFGTAFSGELPQARNVLLFGNRSDQIFLRRNLLTRRQK